MVLDQTHHSEDNVDMDDTLEDHVLADGGQSSNRRQVENGVLIHTPAASLKHTYLTLLAPPQLVHLILALDADRAAPIFPEDLSSAIAHLQAMAGTPPPQPPNPIGPPIFDPNIAAIRRQQRAEGPLPSYEEMIVHALAEFRQPQGVAPKDLFAWMEQTYPLTTNFRPSASQALQKAYKRGRLDKVGGKYRLNLAWSGGATSSRATRKPNRDTQSLLSSAHPWPSPHPSLGSIPPGLPGGPTAPYASYPTTAVNPLGEEDDDDDDDDDLEDCVNPPQPTVLSSSASSTAPPPLPSPATTYPPAPFPPLTSTNVLQSSFASLAAQLSAAANKTKKKQLKAASADDAGASEVDGGVAGADGSGSGAMPMAVASAETGEVQTAA